MDRIAPVLSPKQLAVRLIFLLECQAGIFDALRIVSAFGADGARPLVEREEVEDRPIGQARSQARVNEESPCWKSTPTERLPS
jgi:hypothetical protein